MWSVPKSFVVIARSLLTILIPVMLLSGCVRDAGSVLPRGLSIILITPATGIPGQSANVTITGSGFDAGATVNVSGSGVSVSNIQFVNATTITATLGINEGASPGARNITVTDRGTTSNALQFTVTSTQPTVQLAGISPASGTQGTSVNVTLTGTGFTNGAGIGVSGSGVTVSNITTVSSTSITATFTISSSAAAGARNVTLTDNGATVGPVNFTVIQQSPTLNLISIDPNNGDQDGETDVTLTGTDFDESAVVNVSGTLVTVTNLQVVSSTEITATFDIDFRATPGPRNVTITDHGVTSNPVTFTVNAD